MNPYSFFDLAAALSARPDDTPEKVAARMDAALNRFAGSPAPVLPLPLCGTREAGREDK